MKTDIKHEGIWWHYIETCDRCGQQYEWQRTNEPDIHEADFCIDCMIYFLDNDIPYESIKHQYKKEC